ncbi:hypothetical protein D3C76_1590780 [compost metagenome]
MSAGRINFVGKVGTECRTSQGHSGIGQILDDAFEIEITSEYGVDVPKDAERPAFLP